MKVTVVCDVLGEENNGATHAGMNFIRSLQEKGHEVKVVCCDQDKKGKTNYYVCPQRNLWPFNGYVRKVGVTIAKPNLTTIEEALDGADVIHLHLPFSMSNKAIKVAKKKNIPLTASFHMQAENFTCHIKMQKVKPLNDFVYKYIYKRVYRHVDAVHYPTEFIRNTFEGRIKKRTNGYVISNGVNSICDRREVEKPENLKDKFIILSIGRYCGEKAQDILIKAVAHSKYKDKIHLFLAGQGPMAEKYKTLCTKLGVDATMRIFSRQEISDCLNYCDLYVHPARIELEGIACLEAICCGKTTIVSNSKKSATKYFAVDERCIFENNNEKSLADRIDFFIENEDIRKEIANKYYESSGKFNQACCMDNMEKMLFDVIEKNKKK